MCLPQIYCRHRCQNINNLQTMAHITNSDPTCYLCLPAAYQYGSRNAEECGDANLHFQAHILPVNMAACLRQVCRHRKARPIFSCLHASAMLGWQHTGNEWVTAAVNL